ncbi:hypothetical protein RHSIM_Rhsim04G0043700 [Rhododendron simsii]|uniref:DUF4283 domain-containing protein n=1 Tax=Rhododendron simsii TaxID=118357 RepID=A0A834LQM7_RHOSS|nr:hypothetical protein RHSIM_Rhsim04G0043700 [Rhododendron simsii]
MAGDLTANFPDLLTANTPCLRVLGSPISRAPPNIDIIGMLERASVPNFEHLKVNDSDGPAAKQIKELNAEVLKLQWLLAEKEKLLVSPPPAAAGISLPHATLPVSWKDKVAVDTSAPRMALQFFAPSVINEKIVVQPPEEVVTLGNEKWKDCVVGYFIDRRLPFKSVKDIAERIWSKFGLIDVLSNDEGFFFFQFDKVGAFREVIEAGPWHFGGRLLVLQQWHPHMCLKKELVSKIPIWVQLYNVPLELWTAPGLSYVASAIGRPLYADRMTETCKRLNYAKVCVEVDVDSELLDSFDVVLANGDTFTIKAWYPWQPLKCDKCKVFGHRPCQVSPSENVKVDPKQVWVVKAQQNPLQTVSQAQEVIGQVVGPNTIIAEVDVSRALQGCDSGQEGIMVSGDNTLAAVPILRSARVLDPGGTSDPNKFAVLQSLSALEDNGDAVFLPSENDFTAGLIAEVNSIRDLPVQKGRGRGRNKKKPSQ